MYKSEKEMTLEEIKIRLFHQYYKNLNEKQKEAVFSVNGPLLVLAGAGSGKTTVLVQRISHIIKFGNAYYSAKRIDASKEEIAVLESFCENPQLCQKEALDGILSCFADQPCEPYRILAITFTNKAANEMKERLSKELGERANEIWAGTFHSVCVRLLRQFHEFTPYPSDFTIYDQDDAKKLISTILKEKKIEDEEITPRYLMNVISRAKNELLSPEEFEVRNRGSEKRRICAEVYSEYQKRLLIAAAVDFDDILTETVKLLENNEKPRLWCQNKFRYTLVDEYQDTNHAQYRLMRCIAQGSGNVMAVGDDDQSIYKFRGAAVENILNFDREFPDAKVILLEQNYRSTKTIIDAANAVIAHNDSRHGKTLWSSNDSGKKIVYRQLETQENEAVYIAEKISSMVMTGRYSYNDFAVLYRTKAQSNTLETVFAKSGVPHRLLAGMRFYERSEVKDVIAYLRLIHNTCDLLSLERAISSPRRGIGNTTMEKAKEIANSLGKSVFEILDTARSHPSLSKSVGKLEDFCRLIRRLSDFSEFHLPSETVREVIERSGYWESLSGDENEEKRKNVEELISSAIFYEERSEEATLAGFLEEISLVSDIDNYDSSANSVVLMTIHAAKGLEFPVVFLAGMEENLFPSPMSTQTQSDLEEERRLAYVAMTRAKRELFLTSCYQRMLYGKTNYNSVSRFVEEIPETFLDTPIKKGSFKPQENPYGRRDSYRRDFHSFSSSPVRTSFAAPASPPQKPKAASAAQPKKQEAFLPGARVRHAIFGIGTVLTSKSFGSDTLYEIEFDTVGKKKLMGNYAKLTAAN